MYEDNELDQKGEQIRQLLKDVLPDQQTITNSDCPQNCDDWDRRLKILPSLFILTLIGSMIPHPTANHFFCIAAVVCGLALGLTLRTNPTQILRKFKMTFTLLVGLSLLSGCSPMLFGDENVQILELCREDDSCKVGIAQGIAILGFEIQPASIELAQQNGNVSKVRAAETKEGFGLVRLSYVRVYGS